MIQHEQLTLLTGITLHPVPVIITDGATIAAQPSPFRLSTFSNIPCVTWKREVSRSGDAAIKRVKVFLSQLTKFFSSGWRFTAFLPSRRLFRELQILDDMLRRLGHDPAAIVEPFAPGASADLMKIPRAQDAGLLPSNLQKRVKNTVRIGTLIPTSSVSVPQMTLSNPF